jgi:hypothetical protein
VNLTADGRRYILAVGEDIQLAMEKTSDHVVHFPEMPADHVQKHMHWRLT